jgi:predicted TIM-barrel fold metal-dependent hydrolase
VKLQNEKLAEICAAQPDRFVALASVALQHPDLAAEQLEDAVKQSVEWVEQSRNPSNDRKRWVSPSAQPILQV